MCIDNVFLTSMVSGSSIIQGTFPRAVSFSIDSRTLKKNNIFVALSGTRQEGHDFLYEALRKGASGIIIAEKHRSIIDDIDAKLLQDILIVTVPKPLQALLSLARAWRKQFHTPLIAITGSVGKTSTKMILANIFQEHKVTYLIAQGNQNTLLGVALNILRMNDTYCGAVFEIGINQRGEMGKIVDILRPTTALITYVGHSHMEGLGSLVDIAVEKRDIFKYFPEDQVGFVNGDQSIIADVAYAHPMIKFGLKTTNQIQARKIVIANNVTKLILKIYNTKISVVLPYTHSGMIINVLAAISVAQYLNIPYEVIVHSIQQPLIVARRFEQQTVAELDSIIIDDCYNASPESMKAALVALQHLETDAKKIVVLGDMLELGAGSAFWHRQLGRLLRKVPSLQHVVLVGDMIQWTKNTVPLHLTVDVVPSWQEAIPVIEKCFTKRSVLLVKGSRDIGLDNIVDHFIGKYSSTTSRR